MVADLVLIGLGITLEPFPLIAFLLILSSEKGTRKGLAFVLGWLACLVVVIGGRGLAHRGQPPAPSTAPSTAVLAIKLALGVVLILYAIWQWRRMGRPRKTPAWMGRLDQLSALTAAGLAAFLQPWTPCRGRRGHGEPGQALERRGSGWSWCCSACWPPRASCTWSCPATFRPVAADEPHDGAAELAGHPSGPGASSLICLLLGFWLAGKSIYLLVT